MKLLFVFILFFTTFTIPTTAQNCILYFNTNSSTLRINDVEKLQTYIETYKLEDGSFFLVGHTDKIGASDQNLILSQKRVESVKNYLISKLVNVDDIKCSFEGELKPISEEHMYNRRVEVFYTKNDSSTSSYSDFITSIKPIVQDFKINVNQDISFEGQKGTIVTIPAKAFLFPNGNHVDGDVDIKLSEYYNISDFISDRLSTITNGNIIKSNGMVNITAFKDGKELILNDSSEIELSFPKQATDRFLTFYGKRQNDGRMNWLLDRRKRKPDSYGVTIGPDNNSLVITDYNTALYRNKSIRYSPKKSRFINLSEKEQIEIDKQIEEQEKLELFRDKYYNTIRSNKLKYINCDALINTPSMAAVNYNIIINNNDVKTENAFLILRSTNSILELQRVSDYTFGINARLPLDVKYELLVFGTKNETIYMHHSELTLQIKKVDNINLVETNPSVIKNILNK